MAMLDVGEVGGVAASVVRMAIGAARASVSSALTFGHAYAVNVKIRNVFGQALALFGGSCKTGHSNANTRRQAILRTVIGPPSLERSNSSFCFADRSRQRWAALSGCSLRLDWNPGKVLL